MGVQPPWYPQTVKEGLQFSYLAYAAGAGLAGEDGTHLRRSFHEAFRPKKGVHRTLLQKLQARVNHGVHRGFVEFSFRLLRAEPAEFPLLGHGPYCRSSQLQRSLPRRRWCAVSRFWMMLSTSWLAAAVDAS